LHETVYILSFLTIHRFLALIDLTWCNFRIFSFRFYLRTDIKESISFRIDRVIPFCGFPFTIVMYN